MFQGYSGNICPQFLNLFNLLQMSFVLPQFPLNIERDISQITSQFPISLIFPPYILHNLIYSKNEIIPGQINGSAFLRSKQQTHGGKPWPVTGGEKGADRIRVEMNLKRFVSVMSGRRDRFLSGEVGPSIDPREFWSPDEY